MDLLIDDAKEGLGFDIVARNGKAGRSILKALASQITELYIDFDLGLLSSDGLNVIEWALENNCLPDIVIIVSLNPNGIEYIRKFLIRNNYKQKSNARFVRE